MHKGQAVISMECPTKGQDFHLVDKFHSLVFFEVSNDNPFALLLLSIPSCNDLNIDSSS